MSNISFHAMAWDDIDAVVALENDTFTIPWSRDAFETELSSNPLARYIILEEDGKFAGYAGMWIVLDEAHIMNVAIASSYRGCGLGKALMQEMIRIAARSGVVSMTLEVRRSNDTARNLYASFGFKERGVRPGYYTDNGEDALLLWLEGVARWA